MEFKGTKGQWYIDTELESVNEYGMKVRVISSDYGEELADVFGNNEEEEANALLISKAPEMLEMLERARKMLLFVDVDTLANEIEQLIKEATELK